MLCRLLLLLFLGFFSFGSRFPLTSMDSPHRGPTSFDTELTGAWAWAFARACQSISLPARWSEILPCSAFSQLCSPPLIAFINYIIKSVMTERPNHLPSSLAGPLFQLNCRVIVCWVPKLPFSCNRPNRPSDRANQLCVCPKNHFHFPLISLGNFLFLCLCLYVCLSLSSSIVVWSFASAARVLQPLTLGQFWLP